MEGTTQGTVKEVEVPVRELNVFNESNLNSVDHLKNRDRRLRPTCMVHPDTYLNKILIGGEKGKMELWNFNTGTLVYDFKALRRISCNRINSMSPAPALDVVAVGLSNGTVQIINIRLDEILFSLGNATEAAGKGISTSESKCLSFNSNAGKPLLAVGGSQGVIVLWDLEKRKVQTLIRDAHSDLGGVTSVHFFAGESILMSTGMDNAIKFWILDNNDGSARLLRFRCGHSLPPTIVSYYGNGKKLLSAGSDRAFRVFSTIQDQQSCELSQGNISRKAKRLKRLFPKDAGPAPFSLLPPH